METIICLAIISLLNMYAMVSGTKDAVLWSRLGTEAYPWNEHIIFVIERGIFFGTPMLFTFIDVETAMVLIMSAVISFPFWHNGFYYTMRRTIDVPDYRWNSDSTTSTARLQITWKIRLALFIISNLGLILFYVFKN